LRGGVDPDLRDSNENQTPLMIASARGADSTVRVLLAAGANVHATDNQVANRVGTGR